MGGFSPPARPVEEPRPEIGIVFQDPTLLPWKTALQNILFPIEMMQKSRAAHVDRAAELLRLVGLHDAAQQKSLGSFPAG